MNYTEESIGRMQSKAVANYKSIKTFIRRLGRMQPQKLDKFMLEQHNLEFQQINCLECANCCKTISPAIYESDIRRIGAALKMKPADVISSYLLLDKDGEYVFKKTPCPFLDKENYCAIYESRPKACREYPHTNRKRFYQILELTARNTKVCPTVFNIIEKMRKTNLSP